MAAAGVDIRLLGPMPTPAIAYLTRTLRVAAGIVISASHNPYDDNGIKFFSAEGDKLPDEVELAIEEDLDQPLQTVDSASLGKARRVEDARGRYIEFCKSTVPSALISQGAQAGRGLCQWGHLSHRALCLRGTGGPGHGDRGRSRWASTSTVAWAPPPRSDWRTMVLKKKAHLGIAFDGDGDRVLMLDAQGRLVDGDQLIYHHRQATPVPGRPAGRCGWDPDE